MAILKIVYTEQDKSVQLYRDCDIETICHSWLDAFIEAQDMNLVFVLTTAQELLFKTMQMLLICDYKQLTTDDVLFYIEDRHCLLDSSWHWVDYPIEYPNYQANCLDVIWGL